MRAKASAITASRPLRYWRFSSLVSLVGLVGIHRHVVQALRNLCLDIVIITVCSPTRKRRTKTAALSFMAVSIKVIPHFTVGASAQAMPVAPLHQPDSMITQVRQG